MVHIPRTDVENGALAVFRSISNSYKIEKAQKKDKPCDLSCLVDQTVRESNLECYSFHPCGITTGGWVGTNPSGIGVP